ncbi:MAG TPA: BamA/TamA family outer membrane protein [Chitinispirillaceae bacterium]|nr:BamA/TamA family outer membrane protein [Chitinispirillaceae bacterium]
MHITCKLTILFVIFNLSFKLCSADGLSVSQPDSINLRISKINIYGNKKTKTRAIILLMGLDTGAVFDSVKLRESEKELEETNLFSKVDVFTLKRQEGIEVFVIVEEKYYISPSGGGMYYQYKHNKNDLWLRLELGLANNNFRGMMENLYTSISVWDWRSLSLSWSKPLLTSDFFFTISSGLDYFPDEVRTVDHFVFSNRFRFGRKIKNRTKVSVGLNPTFRRDTYTIENIILNGTVTDTVTTKKRLETNELFSSIFWISDYRRPFFDPQSGWLGYAEIKSNHLHPDQFDPFIQLTTSFSYYHTGILPTHKLVSRFQSVLRNNDGGPFHSVELGGNGSLRGYSSRVIGLGIKGNNSLSVSAEYRFPIFYMPAINLPVLSKYNKFFASITQRIDGALIFDYGRVSESTRGLLGISNGPVETGIGIGIGIRSMILNLERSLALDIIWGKDNSTKILKFKKVPVLHTYIDLYF